MNRKKALLAVVFASGILNSPLPALCDNKLESTDSIFETIVNNKELTPGDQAYCLLRLADNYLTKVDRTAAEDMSFSGRGWRFINVRRRWEEHLVSWTQQLYLSNDANSDRRKESILASQLPSSSAENKELANVALQRAIPLIDKTSDALAKLNLYSIASQLFQRTGNAFEARRCNSIVDDAIQSCEGHLFDEGDIKAAASILNSRAYGFIPVEISEQFRAVNTVNFTVKEFKESEKLKLRAVAMADRLNETSDLRRRAHRDLSLWYTALGKADKASREKEVLFKLVGVHDDKILYPKAIGCGQLVWWVAEASPMGALCGMG